MSDRSKAVSSGPIAAIDSLPQGVSADDARGQAALRWAAAQLALEPDRFTPASADASFRRYFRIGHGDRSWIVMDAPPQHEDCRPFIHVADLMRAAGLHVPEVLATDLRQGFLLLSDLGSQTYLQALSADNADALFADALDALVRWQQASRPAVLPPYDRVLLARELDLFVEWYLGRHLGVTLDAAERRHWNAVCERLIDSALGQPQVFVHRDYMPRNLMISRPNPGILDFQDAVLGPYTYDVISLFKDAFLSWPEARIDGWLRAYHRHAGDCGLPVPAYSTFRRAADWMGVQRHLKVLGVFARIRYRDGKPHYLADVPRFIGYLTGVLPRYAELAPLRALLERRVLPHVGVPTASSPP